MSRKLIFKVPGHAKGFTNDQNHLDFNTFASQYSSLFSDSRDAVKGLVAMDVDGTRDKLVVAFDVDANRQHNIVMKYNVQV